jgi:putative Ca2+/H+ antiporter (TMEM165/GDT1 family)
LIFVAELGDKTQLVALSFATRLPALTVLAGVLVATLLVHVGSVGLGEGVGHMLPALWVKLVAGVAFIGFGLWTLRGDELAEGTGKEESRYGPLMTVALTFFLAELGDKTMLATVTLASQQHAFVAIWLGSTLGMVASDGLAILIGKALGRQLPERLIKYGAASIFLITGVVTVAEAVLARR